MQLKTWIVKILHDLMPSVGLGISYFSHFFFLVKRSSECNKEKEKNIQRIGNKASSSLLSSSLSFFLHVCYQWYSALRYIQTFNYYGYVAKNENYFEIWCRFFFISEDCSKQSSSNQWLFFMTHITMCMCLCGSFHLLIFYTICLVGFSQSKRSNWFSFFLSFFRSQSIVSFVSFAKTFVQFSTILWLLSYWNLFSAWQSFFLLHLSVGIINEQIYPIDLWLTKNKYTKMMLHKSLSIVINEVDNMTIVNICQKEKQRKKETKYSFL